MVIAKKRSCLVEESIISDVQLRPLARDVYRHRAFRIASMRMHGVRIQTLPAEPSLGEILEWDNIEIPAF